MLNDVGSRPISVDSVLPENVHYGNGVAGRQAGRQADRCVVRHNIHEAVPKSFRTGRLERELQVVQLSATPLGAVVSLFCESV
jgi:hypothetical protein